MPTDLPIVAEAIKRGIPLSNDTQIFMEAVPCKTVGITGSAGKTTTTSLVGRMALRANQESGGANDDQGPRVFIGGNIGDPLIIYVDDMKPADLAILEISSFQLEQMTISPHVAAVLNITPNHLDRHGTMEAYTAAKGPHPGVPVIEMILRCSAGTMPVPGPCATRCKAGCIRLASAAWMRKPKAHTTKTACSSCMSITSIFLCCAATRSSCGARIM